MWFHVFNRGVDRQDIFHDDDDFLSFESLVADAVDRFGIEVHGLVAMTNHFHALVHCTDDTLSESLHRVQSIYAGRYNHRYERTGSLFANRFKSVPIATDEHLLVVSRYIHRNPVDIVGERALTAYRWSTLAPYLGSRPTPAWLTTDAVLAYFGGDRARYGTFVDIADEADGVAAMITGAGWTIDDVERSVATAAHVDAQALHERTSRVIPLPQLAAVVIAVDRRVATAAEIADRYEMPTASAARRAASRGRALRATNADFATLCEQATAQLLQSHRGLSPV